MRGRNWEYSVIRYLYYTQSCRVFFEDGLRLVLLEYPGQPLKIIF